MNKRKNVAEWKKSHEKKITITNNKKKAKEYMCVEK